ncbi:MAG TPA: hypothetical protein ENN17_00245, partial [bacterium]|nr:hypothetical protein [bacterium]
MPQKDNASWEAQLEAQMKRLEKRLEEIGRKIEKEGEAFGKRIEARISGSDEEKEKGRNSGTVLGGALLVLIGLIWLGNNLQWFRYQIPWVPVVLIAVG